MDNKDYYYYYYYYYFSVLVKDIIDNSQKNLDGAIQNIGLIMTITMQINTKASLFLN